MSTISTVTPNLRPGYDRNILESLSNRRESVPLIVVVVGVRRSKSSRYKVDGHVQNFRAETTSRRQVLHGRITNRVWSHLQSCVIVSRSRRISSSTSHMLSRWVLPPISDAFHDLHLQSLATIGGACKRAITIDWRICIYFIH